MLTQRPDTLLLLDAAVTRLLRDAPRADSSLIRKTREVTGLVLSRPEFVILEQLRGRSMRLTDLARAVGVSASSLTSQAQRLETKGVLQRNSAADDRRVALVGLTKRGTAVNEIVLTLRRENLLRVLSGWSHSDRERLVGFFGRIGGARRTPQTEAESLDIVEKGLTRMVFVSGRAQTAVARQTELATGVPVSRVELILLDQLVVAPSRPIDLSASLGVAPPHITRQIQQLEAKALVEKSRDGLPGRAVLVRLTERGHQVIDTSHGIRLDDLRRRFASWPNDEIESFALLIGRLGRALVDNP